MSKRKLPEADVALFREAMKNVKPLKKSDKVELKAPRSLTRRLPTQARAANKITVNEFSDLLRETVTTDQYLFFSQPGLPPKLLRELKQGRIKQEAILDLHGYTIETARDALSKMINICLKRGIRCFRIIHGKGKLQNTNQPVLKNHVNNWLQQHNCVLAFCSAKPPDGGTGAVYVLLKNMNKASQIYDDR